MGIIILDAFLKLTDSGRRLCESSEGQHW